MVGDGGVEVLITDPAEARKKASMLIYVDVLKFLVIKALKETLWTTLI